MYVLLTGEQGEIVANTSHRAKPSYVGLGSVNDLTNSVH